MSGRVHRLGGDASRRTAIVAAMRTEVAPLLGVARIERAVRVAGLRLWCGRLERAPVVIAVTGEGAAAAERGASLLLRRFPCERLLVLGISGGLTPDVEPLSLIVARSVFDVTRPLAPPEPAWVERALDLGDAQAGIAVTVPAILGDPRAKAELAARLPAGLDAAVADLESAAYACVATGAGLPYLVVRAVSDGFDETLPFDPERCRRSDGGISRPAVVRHALTHPRSLGPLWSLRGRVRECGRRLRDHAAGLLRLETVSAEIGSRALGLEQLTTRGSR